MNAEHEDVYIMRGEGDGEDDDSTWLVPRPAEEVIVEELLAESDLEADDFEPLTDHVDFTALRGLLAGDDDADEVTFTVEGWSVTVTDDGAVTVSNAE